MVSGGMKCVKYLLFFFNLIFFLAGLALIIIGTLVQTKLSSYVAFLGPHMNSAAIFIIVVGVIVFVIGFFGCCGAYKENQCMIMTFAIILAVVLILEIAAAITAYVLRNQINSLIEKGLTDGLTVYNMSSNATDITNTWDAVQADFDCCGVYNYTDWEDNYKLDSTSSVPDSCCIKMAPGCGTGHLADGLKIYTEGCKVKLINFLSNNILAIGGAAIALAIIEIIGIVIACCLARSIKREYEVV